MATDELRRAKPAQNSYVHQLNWDANILKLLPPQLTITASDEMARKAALAAAAGKSYVDFEPSARATSKAPDEIEITGDEFVQSLIVWGRGDFTGDGLEDLLVQTSDAFPGGTYRAIRLFILTRLTENGPLSLVRELI